MNIILETRLDWFRAGTREASASKETELDPQPDKVDEVKYEEGDFVDVRARSFPAGAEFMDQNFTSQFGEGDDNDWTDDDDDEDGPDCPQQ